MNQVSRATGKTSGSANPGASDYNYLDCQGTVAVRLQVSVASGGAAYVGFGNSLSGRPEDSVFADTDELVEPGFLVLPRRCDRIRYRSADVANPATVTVTTYDAGDLSGGADPLRVSGYTPRPTALPTPQYATLVHAAPAADQSIPNNTDTQVTFVNSESVSPAALADLANNRFAIQQTAIYVMSATASWVANGTGKRRLWFVTTPGSSFAGQADYRPNIGGAGNPQTMSVTGQKRLTAGTVVALWCYQNSGGALGLGDSAADWPTKFSIVKVSEV